MWHACVPLRCRDVELPLLVQSSRESPKSGGVQLFPLAHDALALPAKSPLSHSPTLVFKLSFPVLSAVGICGELFNSLHASAVAFGIAFRQTNFQQHQYVADASFSPWVFTKGIYIQLLHGS